ncbi:enoyl-CoA hydratase/isomerase family protein [Nocardia sp. CA2R105]|uniref:enoyl-CoA hydratase-related protein n=1 Tax=Nocardia coffeae TaxID=2873381 RepID=UPI001CA7911F|nr:enoyl-CoA hydratase-related protein [Nocardia coffeae]MBY8858650.1 enoyl-CoA hydratase/isomerase family protein [Nocardia coffeae]
MIRHERLQGGLVSQIVVDRQERRNALDPEHWSALTSAIAEAREQGARAVVLTGAGSTFCAGGDLNSDPAETGARLEDAFEAIRRSPVPVLAHLNGPAIGAGAQLAVTCDLRVMSPAADLRVPAAAISLPVSPGTIRRIVALAGVGAARAMLIGGDVLNADRAFALGLADRVGELAVAVEWAGRIAGYAPLLVAYFKEQLQVEDLPGDACEFEATIGWVRQTEDYADSVAARRERRRPVFVGR